MLGIKIQDVTTIFKIDIYRYKIYEPDFNLWGMSGIFGCAATKAGNWGNFCVVSSRLFERKFIRALTPSPVFPVPLFESVHNFLWITQLNSHLLSSKGIHWLVVWNMFYFSYIGNNHPNWLSYFSEGLKPPTSRYIMTYIYTYINMT